MLNKNLNSNELERFIERNGLRQIKKFTLINGDENNDYPQLNIDMIQLNITYGTFQIKSSISYIKEHKETNGCFPIYFYNDEEKSR